MAYVLKADDTVKVEFAPATIVEEVLQNVRTIVTTIKYSVPLDRGFGIDGEVVDLPVHVAQAKLTNEIFRAIRRYEPRAEIKGIRFEANLDGRLVPTLEVEVKAK